MNDLEEKGQKTLLKHQKKVRFLAFFGKRSWKYKFSIFHQCAKPICLDEKSGQGWENMKFALLRSIDYFSNPDLTVLEKCMLIKSRKTVSHAYLVI